MKKSNKKTRITAIYVRRSVSDKDKCNNSLSINAQKEECVTSAKIPLTEFTVMTENQEKIFSTALRFRK